MATPNLSELRGELRKVGCQIKSQLDGSWAIFEPKGNRIILASLDEANKYLHNLKRINSNTASPKSTTNNKTQVHELDKKERDGVQGKQKGPVTEVKPLSEKEKHQLEMAKRGPVTEVKPLTEEELGKLKNTSSKETPPSSGTLSPEKQKNGMEEKQVQTSTADAVASEEDKSPDGIFSTLKTSAEKKARLSAEQKFELAAGQHCFNILREERLKKGLNVIQSEIKSNILLAGCPSVLADKTRIYVEKRLEKECNNGTIIMRKFKNHLGEDDTMFFDAQYAYLLSAEE